MTLQFGDVVLIRVPFHQTAGAKIRPAVALMDSGDADILIAPVTSQARGSQWDFALVDWRGAGLNTISYVRVHKISALVKNDIARQLGQLSEEDRNTMARLLCQALCRPQLD